VRPPAGNSALTDASAPAEVGPPAGNSALTDASARAPAKAAAQVSAAAGSAAHSQDTAHAEEEIVACDSQTDDLELAEAFVASFETKSEASLDPAAVPVKQSETQRGCRPRWRKNILVAATPSKVSDLAAAPAKSQTEPGRSEVAAPTVLNKPLEAAPPWLLELPSELQLVEWLGSRGFLDELCPCDITGLVDAQQRYMEKHHCQETL
jgi:hypothetical protein